jgi:ribosomal protein S18 acetylase RimI-like enzyme
MDLSESEDFDIQYTTLYEMETLRKWLKWKGMLHWYPPADEQELDIFVRIWMGFCRSSAALTAFYQKSAVGMAVLFLMPYRKVAHECMFQIIVDPEHQRRGVGRALVKNLMHLAKNYFHQEGLYAEVLDESPLIPLLQSMDFEEFARQEKYVKEDEGYSPRILMGRLL